MDHETRSQIIGLYQALRNLQMQHNLLSLSVRALIETWSNEIPDEFLEKYDQACRAQALDSVTQQNALALDRIDVAIRLLSGQTE